MIRQCHPVKSSSDRLSSGVISTQATHTVLLAPFLLDRTYIIITYTMCLRSIVDIPALLTGCTFSVHIEPRIQAQPLSSRAVTPSRLKLSNSRASAFAHALGRFIHLRHLPPQVRRVPHQSLFPFISQPMDLDNGPSASSPHPTPKEAPYAFEHVGDMSDLDESEPEDDLSPILDKVIVSSINKITLVSTTNPISVFLTRRSQFLKPLLNPKNSCSKLFTNAKLQHTSPSLRMLPCERH